MKKKKRCFILEENGYVLSSPTFYENFLPIYLIDYFNVKLEAFLLNFHLYSSQDSYYKIKINEFENSCFEESKLCKQ